MERRSPTPVSGAPPPTPVSAPAPSSSSEAARRKGPLDLALHHVREVDCGECLSVLVREHAADVASVIDIGATCAITPAVEALTRDAVEQAAAKVDEHDVGDLLDRRHLVLREAARLLADASRRPTPGPTSHHRSVSLRPSRWEAVRISYATYRLATGAEPTVEQLGAWMGWSDDDIVWALTDADGSPPLSP